MLILGIESSTPRSSVAIANQDRVLAGASLGVPQRHGEFLAPAIDFCLTQAGYRAADITGITVGVGPGLYTGLRVGIATAQTLAAAMELPVVGLSGLDALAFKARHVRRLICATIDARRSEVFWAFYRCSPGGVQRETELSVGSPDTLAAEIQGLGEECLVIGDGGARYRDMLLDAGADVAANEMARPDAADLVELAVPRFVREETTRPESLQPIYLRKADAKIGWETRGRLRGGGRSGKGGTGGEGGEGGEKAS